MSSYPGSEKGCGTIAFLLLLVIAINFFFYWLAYQVAEALGAPGWVGVALVLLGSFIVGSARVSSK